MAVSANDPKRLFGRKDRTALEKQAGKIIPSLVFDKDEQISAAEGRFQDAFAGVSRAAALEGSGLTTGFSGRNIRAAGTLGAGLAAEKGAIERQAGTEQRANLQALIGAQAMENQRDIAQQQHDLRSQESTQEHGLRLDAQAESERSGASQRRLAEGQLTGRISDVLDRDAVLKEYSLGDGTLNANKMNAAGIFEDPVTGEFVRRTETLSERQMAEVETSGAAQRRLGEAQLTGDLEGEAGEADQRTLAGQQQDIAAEQAQSQIELAERQRQDARDATMQELGLQSYQLSEQARQFDATLLQQSTEFSASWGLSEEQFLETKRQFDDGIVMQDRQLEAQMAQFNAGMRLQAAEMFGGDGISRGELANALNAQRGDPSYRRDLDFNDDGIIDSNDNDIFSDMAGGPEEDVIRGRSTLAQRELEFKDARFETEAAIQGRALGIEESKINQAFTIQKQQIDDAMAQFNSAFSGYLYESDPESGMILLKDANGDLIESAEHQIAMQNITRVEKAMKTTLQGLATTMGLIKPNESVSKIDDNKMFSLVSLLMADRAPASTNVSFSGSTPPPDTSFFDKMLMLGQSGGTAVSGTNFGR